MQKNESALKVGIPIGSVFFGALVGPALVTGSYAVNYFAKYGVVGLLLPLCYAVFIGIIFTCGFEHTRILNENIEGEKVYDYSSLARGMYGKFAPVLLPFYELWLLLAMVITGATVVATAASLISEFIGVPILVGAMIMAAVNLVIATFGADIIRKTSTGMMIGMICLVIFLVILSLSTRGDNLVHLISIGWKPEDAPGAGTGVWRLFMLSCSASSWALGLGAVAQKITTKKHSLAAGLSAGIGGCLAFLLSLLVVLPYCPDVITDTVPILTIIKEYLSVNMPWLPAVYYILMFLALASSGAPALFVVSNRIKKLVPAIAKRDGRKLDLTVGIIYEILCICLSLFGLTTIVSQFFQYLGYIGMTINLIPMVIIWPILRSRGVIPTLKSKGASAAQAVSTPADGASGK